ncbi:cadmium resistance transporter [Streptomyces sp. NPDC057798]|uniref:cadmium resistance transporter n=1 Tax=Streptomyces sp. NPDC057798 TaxID=3346252 RepID=UPI0036B5ADC7
MATRGSGHRRAGSRPVRRTNIDDVLILALFFAQGAGHPGSTHRIVLGQYLGFAVILAVAVAAAFGATFLPESAIPYLGLLPLALGLKAAWQAWKDHRSGSEDEEEEQAREGGPGPLEVGAAPSTTAATTSASTSPPTSADERVRRGLPRARGRVMLRGLVLRHPAPHRQGSRSLGPHPAAPGPDHHRPAHPHRGRRLRPVITSGASPDQFESLTLPGCLPNR